jgi:hypothetical protein
MNMVGHASDAEDRTIEAVTDPAEIMLHLIPNVRVLRNGRRSFVEKTRCR